MDTRRASPSSPPNNKTASGVRKATRFRRRPRRASPARAKKLSCLSTLSESETDDSETNPFSINPLHRTRRYRRSWDELLDHGQEKITNLEILSNLPTGWHEFGRVLLSRRVRWSYIYEDTLFALGHLYVPILARKHLSPFGILEVHGFTSINVRLPTAGSVSYPVDFYVLSSSVPKGGVAFILGKLNTPGNLHNPNAFQFDLPPPLLPPTAAAFCMVFSSDPAFPFSSAGIGKSGDEPIEAKSDSDLPRLLLNQHTDTDDDDIDLDTANLSSHPLRTEQEDFGVSPPLPWKLSFAWKSQRLLFDGDELSAGQHDNSVAVAQVGGTSAPSKTELTLKGKNPSTFSEVLQSRNFNQRQIRTAERIELLVNLLEEHYWRTHPALRPARKGGSHGGESAPTPKPAPSTRHPSSRITRKRPPPKKGKGIDNGSGSGDEDDDNDDDGDGGDDDPPSGPPGNGPIQDPDYFACPFLKCQPWPYHETCSGRFRSVSHVIGHLRSEHYDKQCARCHRECKSLEEKNSHINQACPAARHLSDRPAMISEEQWSRLSKRPDQNSKSDISNPAEPRHRWVKRWYCIYDILFPGRPRPDSPYIGSSKVRVALDGVVGYFERAGVHELRRFQRELSLQGEGAQDDEFLAEERLIVSAALIQRLLPQIISSYTSESAFGSMASHNSCMDNCTQPGDMPNQSESSASGANYTPIHTPQADQLSPATRYPCPTQSTSWAEGPSGVTSSTSIGLTAGTTITERMDCTEDSAQSPEDKEDLMMNGDLGVQWHSKVSDKIQEDAHPNALGFVAAWNDKFQPGCLSPNTRKNSNHDPYTNVHAFAYNNGYNNVYANINATNSNSLTSANPYTHSDPNPILFPAGTGLPEPTSYPQQIHDQNFNWPPFSTSQVSSMTRYHSAPTAFPSHAPALPFNQTSYDIPQPLSLGLRSGERLGTETTSVTGLRPTARDLTLTGEYPAGMMELTRGTTLGGGSSSRSLLGYRAGSHANVSGFTDPHRAWPFGSSSTGGKIDTPEPGGPWFSPPQWDTDIHWK